MVDSAADTNPLRTTGEGAFEQTKKRYNVAASRARDQLWVIHSFDPDLHLKAVDIRYRLLQHVKDPDSSLRNFEQQVGRTESPFEKEVLKRLTNAGFRVTTQVEVGYFRIDMVVEGDGKRLAVECDGDRYHPIEKLAEDMNRQAILERLGWRFARIRGSAFYRDPDQAMESVFKRLEDLEIAPHTSSVSGIDSDDRTLIEELKTIIANGFVDETDDDFSTEVNEPVEVVDIAVMDAESPEATQLNEPEVSAAHPERDSEREPIVVDSAVTSTSQTNKGGSFLAEYTHYSGPACHDPRTTGQPQIADDLLNIVKAEGPVQVKRAFDIYLRSCGIKRMGHELRDSLIAALDTLKKSGDVFAHGYRHEDEVLKEVVGLSSGPREVVRQRGDRLLEEIPFGELFSVSQLVASKGGLEVGGEAHLRAVLEALDLKRLTSSAEKILMDAIQGNFIKND